MRSAWADFQLGGIMLNWFSLSSYWCFTDYYLSSPPQANMTQHKSKSRTTGNGIKVSRSNIFWDILPNFFLNPVFSSYLSITVALNIYDSADDLLCIQWLNQGSNWCNYGVSTFIQTSIYIFFCCRCMFSVRLRAQTAAQYQTAEGWILLIMNSAFSLV